MYTSEGFYLSLTKNKDVSKHPKNGADINEIKEILLADIDFDKEFMTFNMPNGKNITIYSYMRNLYGATCKPIEKVEISLTNSVSNESNELCFRDQPVTYTIHKEIKKGYLINEGIIKPNSELLLCEYVTSSIQRPNKEITIHRKKDKTYIFNNKDLSFMDIKS
ncbi:unnamed protein product [Brachionus calyciflorus]|uniref:Uncharacterized protein n=1 Tax=Brachionus calyciflorus TaxID=104777 RepID=A0A814HE66_9BILA|nr:unnamed protein product [Brachionus calyciflorus]